MVYRKVEWVLFPGKTLSAVLTPSETFAQGDSGDTPWYSVSSLTELSFFGGSTISGMRHNGRFNMNYCDGHSKALRWRGSTTNGEGFFCNFTPTGCKIAVPRSQADWNSWCVDPKAVVNTDAGML